MSILNELFDRIFVISLPDSARRERIRNHFKEHQISNWEFFDAVDGSQLPLKQLEAGGLICRTRDWHYQMLPGEFGCALSHYELWGMMELRDHASILICEDDVRFVDDLENRLRRYWPHIENDWGIVHFHTHHPGLHEHDRQRQRIAEGVYVGDDEWGGTVCYAIRQPAAAWLRQKAIPITWAVDGIVSALSSKSYDQQAGRSYVFLPCVAGHDGSISEIDRVDRCSRPLSAKEETFPISDAALTVTQQCRPPVTPSISIYLRSDLTNVFSENIGYQELPWLDYQQQLRKLAKSNSASAIKQDVLPQQDRVICTSAFGEQDPLLRLTKESALHYASQCGADYLVLSKPSAKLLGLMRKFAIIEAAIQQGYEEIAYIDVDTWISPGTPDLFQLWKSSRREMAIRLEVGGSWYTDYELPLMREHIMRDYAGDTYSNTGVVVASAAIWEQVLEQSYLLYQQYPGDLSDQLYVNPAIEQLGISLHLLSWRMNAWIPLGAEEREIHCIQSEPGIHHANGRNFENKLAHLQHVRQLLPWPK